MEKKNNQVDSISGKKSFLFSKNKGKDDLGAVKPTKILPKGKQLENTLYKNKRNKRLKFFEFKRPKFFSLHGVIVILLLLPIFLLGLISYLYQTHNEGKIYSGVRILGMEMGGKTKDEAKEVLDKKIDSYKLTIQGENQKFEATEKDLGVAYDEAETINSAYSYGRDDSVLNNFFNRAKRSFSQYEVKVGSKKYSFKKHDVNLPYTINEVKLDKYLADLESKINVDPKDSQIMTQGSSMRITPAVFGKKLKTAELKAKILAASTKFEATPIELQTDVAKPAILDEKTKDLADKADKITSKSVTLAFQNKNYSPSKSVLVSWITFTRPNDTADWQMYVDQSKMNYYFDTIGKEINVYSVPQKIRVENETKELVTQEGKNGLIIDKAALGSQLASKLQTDGQISIPMPMKVDTFKTEKDYVVVANWDKYIDVNISTQHMEAYTQGGNRVGSWAITTGRNGWNTPTGSFLIQRKAYNVCMPNPPSTQPLCGIHYVSYFTGAGHAIHQAWWRSYFGGQDYVWNGSHGCINAPLSLAQFIYDWAPIGTPVTIHY